MIEPKVIIVEGKTDRDKLQEIISEPVEIICTYGTLSEEKIEELIIPVELNDVYIFVDSDESGEKLRRQLKNELPNATHLYIAKQYREVAKTPYDVLAKILSDAFFEVRQV
ncbi:toprim domain-containing protein [Anaerobacillus sp. MEB173]|uniref:toprim domain-containing protein n=1 Tax=Anaerobacillus sp. MEB173 TaxID=3383345 RepID=UPI003F902537